MVMTDRAHRRFRPKGFRLPAAILLSLLCAFQVEGAVVNPLDWFLQRLSIQTTAGVPTVLDRTLATQSYPMNFTIAGELPQGKVELYAFLVMQNGLTYQSQKCTTSPLNPKAIWSPAFFQLQAGDRLVPYDVQSQSGKTLKFTAFDKIKKEAQVKQLIFGCAPADAVRLGDLSKAHVVIINFVK